MTKPLGESLRAILIAPASVVLLYLLMALVPFLRAPSWGSAWVFWVVASIAVVVYAVAVPAGLLLTRLYHGTGGPPVSSCLAAGLVCAVGAAIVADLPEPNFERVRYYFFAAVSGVIWATTLYNLLHKEPQ